MVDLTAMASLPCLRVPVWHVLCSMFVVIRWIRAHNPSRECICNATDSIAATLSHVYGVTRLECAPPPRTASPIDDRNEVTRTLIQHEPASPKRDMINLQKNQCIALVLRSVVARIVVADRQH